MKRRSMRYPILLAMAGSSLPREKTEFAACPSKAMAIRNFCNLANARPHEGATRLG